MSAASTTQDNARKDGVIQDFPVLAGQKLYKGRPIFLDSSSRYAQTNDGTTITLANDDVFAGITVETIDNTDGSNGDLNVRAYQTGNFLLTFSDTLTQADLGKKVFVNNVTDDAVVTVTEDSGNPESCIGEIKEVISSSTAYVTIDKYVGNLADSIVGDVNIPDNSITNAKINSAAGIVVTKFEGLADGEILIGVDGTGANNAKVVVSGDATIANDGALTIADDAITQDKLDFVKHTVTVTAGTSGTATVTSGAQILGFYVTAMTSTEVVKTIDISGTTLTVTLSGSDTGTIEVLVLEPTA